MHHLILGYGYCGYYLAQEILRHRQPVTAISRHLDPQMALDGLQHIAHDIHNGLVWNQSNTILYYLIPPQAEGNDDERLNDFLKHSQIHAKKIIYFGSSAVYGQYEGGWVNENSPCKIDSTRQQRRLSAETQWQQFAKQQKMDCTLLRIGGIYGPGRIPLEAAKTQTPIIKTTESPWVNHIYVRDLAHIAYHLATTSQEEVVYNIADGQPKPMGSTQQQLAAILGLPLAPEKPWEEIYEKASPLKREFMTHSKLLTIDRILKALPPNWSFTTVTEALLASLNS